MQFTLYWHLQVTWQVAHTQTLVQETLIDLHLVVSSLFISTLLLCFSRLCRLSVVFKIIDGDPFTLHRKLPIELIARLGLITFLSDFTMCFTFWLLFLIFLISQGFGSASPVFSKSSGSVDVLLILFLIFVWKDPCESPHVTILSILSFALLIQCLLGDLFFFNSSNFASQHTILHLRLLLL